MNSLKFLLKIGFTALLAYFLQTLLPWWSVVVAGFLISFIISSKGLSSFVSAFIGIGILWMTMAFMIDSGNDSILSTRVAALFSLPEGWYMIWITAVIGGIAGGFGALTGSHLRSLIMPPDEY